MKKVDELKIRSTKILHAIEEEKYIPTAKQFDYMNQLSAIENELIEFVSRPHLMKIKAGRVWYILNACDLAKTLLRLKFKKES